MENNPAIVKRSLRVKIEPFLERREYLVIHGPRQAGKTTFMRALEKEMAEAGKRTHFITFEDRGLLEIFTSDINLFIRLHIEPYATVFIDEFQYAREGGQKLKFIYDTTGVKVIISGSSSLELQANTGKYMVGRLVDFELLPFSFAEYLEAKDPGLASLQGENQAGFHRLLKGEVVQFQDNIKSFTIKDAFTRLLSEYVVYGGYPAVALAEDEDVKVTLLKSIFQTYIAKDIVDLLRLETETELVKLARLLALQIGNMLVYENLSSESGLYHESLKKHLDILTQTYVIALIQPYFTNKRTEIVKNSMPYFLDTGLRNALINNFSSLEQRTDKGNLFENYVFSALQRHVYGSREIKFWRSKSQAEVDFVLEPVAGEVIPVEVKFAAGSGVALGRSFYSFVEKYEPAIALVITLDRFEERMLGERTRLYCVPGYWL